MARCPNLTAEKDVEFTGQFEGILSPLTILKSGADPAKGEVDAITGATISSRAVVRIINHRLEQVVPLIEAWLAKETP